MRSERSDEAWQKYRRDKIAAINERLSAGDLQAEDAAWERQQIEDMFNARPGGKMPPAVAKPDPDEAGAKKTAQGYYDFLRNAPEAAGKTDAEIEKRVRIKYPEFKL